MQQVVKKITQIQLTQMQTFITSFCQSQNTMHDAIYNDCIKTLTTFNKWMPNTKKWIINVLKKHSQQMAKVIFMLLKPGMTVERFLQKGPDFEMMVWFKNGDDECLDKVHGWDAPNVIYET